MEEKNNNFLINKGALFQLFASATANLMVLADGMGLAWTAPMNPYFLSDKTHIQMTKHQAEWLETCLLLGAIFGILPTVYCVNKKGRRTSILLATCAMLVSWMVIAFAPTVEYLLAARTLGGMAGDMAYVAAPMYTAEIADRKIRGFVSSTIFLMNFIGILIMYIIGPILPFYTAPLLASVFLITELIVFSLIPESPYYLLIIGKHEEAEKSLQKFRSNSDVAEELKEIAEGIERMADEKGRFQDIFLISSNRKAMLIMTVLNTAQQFSCINIILMNIHWILEAAGSVYMESSHTAILFAFLMLLSAVLASFFVDRFGRKMLMIVSSIFTGFCLLSLAMFFNLQYLRHDVSSISWIPIVSVMIYAFVFKFGLGMVPIVITAEIFAPKIKAMGMAAADAVLVVASIGALQIYQQLHDYVGMHVPFYIFSCCSFLTIGFIFFFIPETKGKSLDEIQMILQGSAKEKKEADTRL